MTASDTVTTSDTVTADDTLTVDAVSAVDTAPDAATSPFTMVGDPLAASCVGDSCVIPDHHEQAVVNRQLDENRV